MDLHKLLLAVFKLPSWVTMKGIISQDYNRTIIESACETAITDQ